MKLTQLVSAMVLGASALLGASAPAQAAIATDIIMMVDESGSMSDVQTNLRNNIGAFAAILSAGGVDARYGLIGYGSSAVAPHMLSNFTTAAGFAAAALGLVVNGGTEPGYSATAFALNAIDAQASLFSYRPNALKNLIIFTDEPSNGDGCGGCLTGGNATTQADADALLTSNGALFNAVLRNANTIDSYDELYNAHSGHLYDLNGLNTNDQTVVSAFVNDFANSKLQEIVDYCTLNPTDPACSANNVPEPGTLSLFGLAALGIGLTQRRRARAADSLLGA